MKHFFYNDVEGWMLSAITLLSATGYYLLIAEIPVDPNLGGQDFYLLLILP